MIQTLDASVLVKCVFEEAGSDEAREVLVSERCIAPDFILLETHHVLWKRVRRREMAEDALRASLEALRASLDRLEPSGPLGAVAADLSLAHNHPVYDCLYIALALQEPSGLTTADGKQALLARRVGLDVRMI